MKRKRNCFFYKKVQASFTVEAAVVIPICFIFLVTLLFLAFYMHDRLTAKSVGTEVAVVNAEVFKADKKQFAPAVNVTPESLLIAAKGTGVTVQAENDSVTASVKGSFPIPLFTVRKLLGEASETIGAEITLTHLDAREELLKYKAAADGFSNVSAASGKDGK